MVLLGAVAACSWRVPVVAAIANRLHRLQQIDLMPLPPPGRSFRTLLQDRLGETLFIYLYLYAPSQYLVMPTTLHPMVMGSQPLRKLVLCGILDAKYEEFAFHALRWPSGE
jgi:hypothetical protein